MTYAGQPIIPGSLRLNFNENTAGCSPVVHAALNRMTRSDIGQYPDIDDVTRRVERLYGVPRGWAQITNGLDEGIQMVAQYAAWHARGGDARPEMIIVEPAFEVYAFCADAVGAAVVGVEPSSDFRFPMDGILSSVSPATRVIFLTDPNNPTGLGIPAGAVSTIADAAPQSLVLVDEAYADFSGRTLIGPLLDRHRNLVVGRTFAKAYGLAALRIGALVAHHDTLDALRPMQLPFSVNISAIAALEAALTDRAYVDWYVSESVTSREIIYDFCRRHGLRFWPSEANFVLFRAGADAGAMVDALRARRILVRDKSASPGCDGCIRLTAGIVTDTKTAVSAMEDFLATRAR